MASVNSDWLIFVLNLSFFPSRRSNVSFSYISLNLLKALNFLKIGLLLQLI